MLRQKASRRRFLRSTLIAGSALAAAPAILSAQSPAKKLNLAIIGTGGRGGANLKEMTGENIVALCDVNENNLDFAASKFPQARKYVDFRRLFEESKDIDAVVVSTAEHTHAFATVLALQQKKHVYCEKPLTHSVWEARVIAEAAKKAGVVTQMGTQIHAGNNYRRVVELVQTGAVGPVREVHVWVSRAWGLQTPERAIANSDRANTQGRPMEAMPVPKGLNWDLWLGPAPERPFNEVYFPGPKWYRWWDFGGGTMSDLGSHWNDLPFWALKLRHPLSIEPHGPAAHAEIAPASYQATYEYGARGEMPPVKLTWYQGENKPPQFTGKLIPQWANGVLFVGEKGMLLSDYSKHVLLPEADFKDFKRPEPFIPNSIGHHAEWLDACKHNGPTTCHFDYAGALTEANHLGNVAYGVGKKILWDAKTLKITNAPEAAKFIRREYRKGWKLV